MCHVTMTITSVHRYINYQKMSKWIGLMHLNVNWNKKSPLTSLEMPIISQSICFHRYLLFVNLDGL